MCIVQWHAEWLNCYIGPILPLLVLPILDCIRLVPQYMSCSRQDCSKFTQPWSPDWRLHHACPACTYKLKDEKPLLFSLLFTMDGNDSLKRIRRRVMDEDGIPGPSCKHADSRTIHNDFYLTWENVDKWAHEALQDLMVSNADEVIILRRWHSCEYHLLVFYRMMWTTTLAQTDGKIWRMI
jgi:hypothetical protein